MTNQKQHTNQNQSKNNTTTLLKNNQQNTNQLITNSHTNIPLNQFKQKINFSKFFFIISVTLLFFLFIFKVYNISNVPYEKKWIISKNHHMCFHKIKYIDHNELYKLTIISDVLNLQQLTKIKSVNTNIYLQKQTNRIKIISKLAVLNIVNLEKDKENIFFPEDAYLKINNELHLKLRNTKYFIHSQILQSNEEILIKYQNYICYAIGYEINLNEHSIKLFNKLKLDLNDLHITSDMGYIQFNQSVENKKHKQKTTNPQQSKTKTLDFSHEIPHGLKATLNGNIKISNKQFKITCEKQASINNNTLTFYGDTNIYIQPTNLKISTTSMIIKLKNSQINQLKATKPIKLQHKQNTIQADTAILEKDLLKLQGHVQGKQGNSEINCNECVINLTNNNIKFKQTKGKTKLKLKL